MSTSMESLEHGPQHVYTFYKFSTCFYESCGQKTTLETWSFSDNDRSGRLPDCFESSLLSKSLKILWNATGKGKSY